MVIKLDKSIMRIPTFLKWVGGKRKTLEKIDQEIKDYIKKNRRLKRYHELFIGGGSVFFHVKQKYKFKRFTISDINQDLIDTYLYVRDSPKELINHLKKLKKSNSEDFYYKIREIFNQKKVKGIKRGAIFIYLNKTCFNGMYRVNSKGEFNVPCGRYSNPEIFNKETIFHASELLKEVKIVCRDYEQAEKEIEKGDFVYLDPCYDPIKRTSFTQYTPKRFTSEENGRLAHFIKRIGLKGAKVLLSNNPTQNVITFYTKKEGFRYKEIFSFRSVGSKGSYREHAMELLIKNY